jgi:hypothetical protein
MQLPNRKMTTGQIMIYNTNDCATRTHKKPGMNSDAPEG